MPAASPKQPEALNPVDSHSPPGSTSDGRGLKFAWLPTSPANETPSVELLSMLLQGCSQNYTDSHPTWNQMFCHELPLCKGLFYRL